MRSLEGRRVVSSINCLVVSNFFILSFLAPLDFSMLFIVLYHHGLSASGGHYTLDVLHPNRDLTSTSKPREGWIRIDDELVSDVRAEDVFGGVDRDDRCAYLLFYRRIGGVPGTSRT